MYKVVDQHDLYPHQGMVEDLTNSYEEASVVLTSLLGETVEFLGENREFLGFRSETELFSIRGEDSEDAFEHTMRLDSLRDEAVRDLILARLEQDQYLLPLKVSDL